MYLLESFEDGYAIVARDDEPYRAMWAAADLTEASALVAGMNRPELLTVLAAHRYDIEVGGLDVGGALVKTDRESQGQLNGTRCCLEDGLIPDARWKNANGWATVTHEDMATIAQAVAAHVRSCFWVESLVTDELEAITDNDALMQVNVIERFDTIMAGWLLASDVITQEQSDVITTPTAPVVTEGTEGEAETPAPEPTPATTETTLLGIPLTLKPWGK